MFSPRYTITNKILNSIAKIEAAEEVIRHSPLLPLWEKRFKEDAIVRSVHHGTHIEGNSLNKEEAKEVLLGKSITARPRDVQEVINYRRVINFIDEEAKKNVLKITEGLVKKLHRIIISSILSGEEAIDYRTKQVIIRNSRTGEVTFRPPPPVQVPFLMREFIYWLNQESTREVHPVLRAGIAHHELVRIHPFIDGNGRVARAMATLILFLGGYDIRRFFSLEEYYDRDAASYYKNLQEASKGNLTAWLEYFSLGAAIEFERIKNKVLKLSRDVKMKEKLGGKQIFLSERQVKIIEYIREVGYLQNQSFIDLFPDVSEDTVLREIKFLLDKKLIKKIGRTKAARYISA